MINKKTLIEEVNIIKANIIKEDALSEDIGKKDIFEKAIVEDIVVEDKNKIVFSDFLENNNYCGEAVEAYKNKTKSDFSSKICDGKPNWLLKFIVDNLDKEGFPTTKDLYTKFSNILLLYLSYAPESATWCESVINDVLGYLDGNKDLIYIDSLIIEKNEELNSKKYLDTEKYYLSAILNFIISVKSTKYLSISLSYIYKILLTQSFSYRSTELKKQSDIFYELKLIPDNVLDFIV